MKDDIRAYNDRQEETDKEICNMLAWTIDKELREAESKVWHGHPVWFLDGNPTVGYSKQKNGIRLMFWSGADFNVEALNVKGGKFKDASIFYSEAGEIDTDDLISWLRKSRQIQWDYKNLVKRKGKLLPISKDKNKGETDDQ